MATLVPPESEYFLRVVATVLRLLGRSNREIEIVLHWSPGYLSRLLAGDKKFRFEHLVELARALGLAPQELVWLAYPATGEPFSQAAEGLWRAMASPRSPAGLPAAPDPLDAAVSRVLARMLAKLAPLAAREGG